MTPVLSDDEHIDLVRDADLDWHAGFPLGEDENRYSTLIRAVESAVLAKLAARAGELPELPGAGVLTDPTPDMHCPKCNARLRAILPIRIGYTVEQMQQYARDHAAGMMMRCIAACEAERLADPPYDHAAGVVARMGEPAARLPFHIETRAGIRVLVEKSGGCHPATIYELAMWDALQQPQQYTIDHAAAIAAVTTGMKRLNDERHERTPRSGTTFGGIERDGSKETK